MTARAGFRAKGAEGPLFLPFVGDDNGNHLVGTAADDTLDGLGADDILEGRGGNDALDGGDGIDRADYGSAVSGVIVRLNAGVAADDGEGGSDTLVSIEQVTGGAFDDTIVGSAVANTLDGSTGRDVLVGLAGDDILVGGAGDANHLQGGIGDDQYWVEANDTVVEFAGEGHDVVLTNRSRLTLATNVEDLSYLGAGSFTGIGNDSANAIFGAAGDDVLSGRAGDDALDGGDGTDTADYSLAMAGVVVDVASGATDDGDAGVDTLVDIENLTGSAFADTLYGDAGVNVLNGGSDNDVLVGRGGNDTLHGGAGYDLVDYSDATSGVIAKLNIGQASDGEGGTDTLVSIEDLNGSLHNDVLIGSTEENFLYGLDGSDVLIGLAGDDYLEGGAGAPNQLQGGEGDDRYYVEANDTLVEFENEGFDSVATTLNRYTLRAHFEELAFDGVGDFVGTGNGLDNYIYGGDGNDTLTGGGGDDILVGTSSCGCGGGGTDTVVLSGVQADYLIEDLGGGAWGVTDSVADRDGADFLLDIDQIRFSDGSILVLVPASAPAVDGKSAEQVLPPPDPDDILLSDDAEAAVIRADAPWEVLANAASGLGRGGLEGSLFDGAHAMADLWSQNPSAAHLDAWLF